MATQQSDTPTPPPVRQRTDALRRANAVRAARARLRRRIAAGERSASEVLADCPPEVRSMPVADLLGAQHRWGEARVGRTLRRVPVGERKPLGELTDRQRRALVALLEAA